MNPNPSLPLSPAFRIERAGGLLVYIPAKPKSVTAIRAEILAVPK